MARFFDKIQELAEKVDTERARVFEHARAEVIGNKPLALPADQSH